MPKKLLMVVNVDWFFVSHRLPIALKARSRGYEVHVATTVTDKRDLLESSGFVVHDLNIVRGGASLLHEFKTLWSLYTLFRVVQPDVLHLVTIKPVLYGGLVARLARVPYVIAAVPGLGQVFIARGLTARIRRLVVSTLYRAALGHKNLRTIFQNTGDYREIGSLAKLKPEQCVLIKGSGVDLEAFKPLPPPSGPVTVAMISRLLVDKGVREFVDAARQVKARHPDARFWLVGSPDSNSAVSIGEQEWLGWGREGIVDTLGHRSDVSALLATCHIVVHPSYTEGIPKVLLEAAACGRPVVTTDVPGCEEAIEPGITGLVVPVKNVRALADAIGTLIDEPELRTKMGSAGRDLAEREFSIESVVAKHLELYDLARS